jgi:hypothetical protein
MLENKLKEGTQEAKAAEYYTGMRKAEADRLAREIAEYLKRQVSCEADFLGRIIEVTKAVQEAISQADMWKTGAVLSLTCDDRRDANKLIPLFPAREG